MIYAIGAAIALVLCLIYYRRKAKSAEALLENTETKEELNKKNETISKNKGTLAAEAEKREEVKKPKEESNETISNDLNDLFGKRK